MGRSSRLILSGLVLTVGLGLLGCSPEESGPKTKEELESRLGATVDLSKLTPEQRAKLPNPGDGTPSGPPPQFAGDRTR